MEKQRARESSRALVTTEISSVNQVQVMTPAVMAQVFADCVCVAVAFHDGGGPATAVTTTVTFCEGVKP